MAAPKKGHGDGIADGLQKEGILASGYRGEQPDVPEDGEGPKSDIFFGGPIEWAHPLLVCCPFCGSCHSFGWLRWLKKIGQPKLMICKK